MEHMKRATRGVLLVSLADKIHNLRTILTDLHVLSVEEMWKRFNATPAESLWYYQALHRIFAAQGELPVALMKELTMLVEALAVKISEQAGVNRQHIQPFMSRLCLRRS